MLGATDAALVCMIEVIHGHEEFVLDDDAYNVYGQHLENDDKQGKQMVAASVLSGILTVAMFLMVLL